MTESETPSDVPENDLPETEPLGDAADPGDGAEGRESRPAEEPAEASKSPETGDDDVDEVLVTLEGLEDLPVSEHPPVYSRAHDALRDALAGKADPDEES